MLLGTRAVGGGGWWSMQFQFLTLSCRTEIFQRQLPCNMLWILWSNAMWGRGDTAHERDVSHVAEWTTEEHRPQSNSEERRGGQIVILVFLALDESESSQSIGMLHARHEKPWEQGPGKRPSDDPRVPCWLPVLGNKEWIGVKKNKCRIVLKWGMHEWYFC